MFNATFSYTMAASFSDGSTRREPLTMGKQLVNFITCGCESSAPFLYVVFRQAVLCDWVWRAGGRPHRFPHNNFSSVYRIFTKLGHMIPLWKGKNPIYFGVIRSKVKVTVTINRIFFTTGSFPHDNFSSVY